MKKIIRLIPALLIIFALASCSSKNYNQEMQASEDMFYKGQYLDAARLLLPNVNSAGKDSLLFMMECGLMLHTGGDYETSNKLMLKAGKVAQIIPISVSQQIESFATNDTNANYRGEDFEKVLIHVYAGINFLMLGDYDGARVEFKYINNELAKIKNENEEAKYKQNAMAKYLAAIAFEIVGEKNNDKNDIETAYIEYKQVYELNPAMTMVRDDLLRVSKLLEYDDDYAEWKSKFKKNYNEDPDSGELITIFQSGRSAIKKSRGPLMNDPGMTPAINIIVNNPKNLNLGITAAGVTVALKTAENPIPKFQKRSNKVDRVKVEAGGKTINTTMLEDVENTAVRNLEDDYKTLYKRVALAITTKVVISMGVGIGAKKVAEQFKQTKAFASVIGTLAGTGTGVALFSQMKPDLRCWHTLPANFQLGRMNLKPGKQKLNFILIGDGGIVDRVEKEVEIKKGEKTLVNLRTLF